MVIWGIKWDYIGKQSYLGFQSIGLTGLRATGNHIFLHMKLIKVARKLSLKPIH